MSAVQPDRHYRIIVGTAAYEFLPLHSSAPVPNHHLVSLSWSPGSAAVPRLQQTACFDDAGPNPSWIALCPTDPTLLMICNETMPGSGKKGQISLIRVAPAESTPSFELLCKVGSGGTAPCFGSWTADGKHVLIANYEPASLVSFAVNVDAKPANMVQVSQLHFNDGSNAKPSRQAQAHAHCILQHPLHTHLVFAADLGADSLRLLHFDVDNGSLQLRQKIATTPGSGPRHIAFSEDGRLLFVLYEISHEVAMWEISRDGMSLKHIQTIDIAAPDSLGTQDSKWQSLSGAAIRVSGDGKHLYASMRNDHLHESGDCITVVALDRNASGQPMSVVQHARAPKGGWHIRDIALSPDGAYLVAGTMAKGGEIYMFERNQGSGKLAFLERITAVTSEQGVLSPSCFVWM